MRTFNDRVRERRLELKISQDKLGKAAGLSQATIANIENGRNQGTTELVGLAKALQTTPDWLETGRGMPSAPDVELHENDLVIPQFDTGGAMGHGLVLRDQAGVIENWSVSPEWLRLNLNGYTSTKNICIVTGFGDSMRPLFNPGDPLIVDTSKRSVDRDGVYFFRVGDEGFVKRLQRVPGNGLMAISDNNRYVPWTITPAMDFEVFGRVVKVWRSDDL